MCVGWDWREGGREEERERGRKMEGGGNVRRRGREGGREKGKGKGIYNKGIKEEWKTGS